MQTETLSLEQMLPAKFQPKMSYHWILDVDGIDPFLVKQARVHPWVRKVWPWCWASTHEGRITVTLYDPITPSGSQQVDEWISKGHNQPRTARIKFFDPVGSVISVRSFKGVRVEQVEWQDFNYAVTEPMLITLELSFSSDKLEF